MSIWPIAPITILRGSGVRVSLINTSNQPRVRDLAILYNVTHASEGCTIGFKNEKSVGGLGKGEKLLGEIILCTGRKLEGFMEISAHGYFLYFAINHIFSFYYSC